MGFVTTIKEFFAQPRFRQIFLLGGGGIFRSAFRAFSC